MQQLQTNPWHLEEETQNTGIYTPVRTQLKHTNQLSLRQKDDCKTKNDTKNFTTKQGQKCDLQQKRIKNIKMDSSRGHGVGSCPIFIEISLLSFVLDLPG